MMILKLELKVTYNLPKPYEQKFKMKPVYMKKNGSRMQNSMLYFMKLKQLYPTKRSLIKR